VIEKYTYDVFGTASIFSSSDEPRASSLHGNRFLFTGRELIPETALLDFRNRVYSPALGRFLQTDPLRFEARDINIYRYAFNNSINATDSLGLGIFCYCAYLPPPSGYIVPPAWGFGFACNSSRSGAVQILTVDPDCIPTTLGAFFGCTCSNLKCRFEQKYQCLPIKSWNKVGQFAWHFIGFKKLFDCTSSLPPSPSTFRLEVEK